MERSNTITLQHVITTRNFDYVKYDSFLVANCSRCQFNAIQIGMNVVPNVPVKRGSNMLESTSTDETHDALVPIAENPAKLEQALSEPVSNM